MYSLLNPSQMPACKSRSGRAFRANVAPRPLAVALLAVAFALPFLAGCDEETARREFRGAVSDGLETGVRAIAGGLIDGAFAVFDIGATSGTGGGPSGSVGTTTDSDVNTTSTDTGSTDTTTP